MTGGINIDEETFLKLPAQQQRLVLYQNLKKTKKTHEYIQYFWLSIISVVYMIKKYLPL